MIDAPSACGGVVYYTISSIYQDYYFMAKKKKLPMEAEKKQALQLFLKNDLAKAKSICLQVSKKRPNDFDAHLMLGMIEYKNGNFEQAIKLLLKASELKKSSAKVYFQLGQVYRDCNELDNAIKALQNAIKLKPDYVEAYDVLTIIMQMAGYYHELIVTCRDAVKMIPAPDDFYARMAAALEQTSQLDEAKEAAECSININARNTRALFTLAKIEKRRNDLHAARNRLQTLVNMPLQPAQMSAVAGELGDVEDRLGEYTDAFHSFTKANKVLLRTVPSEVIQNNPIYRKINGLQNYFVKRKASEWTEPDDGLVSPVFLVGFPRSGTTLTEQLLASTGEVHPSDEQHIITRLLEDAETVLGHPLLMPDGFDDLSTEDLTRLRKHYWELVGEMCGAVPDGRQFLDKLPLNIIDLGFIYRIFPQAKVIVVLRDPRDCCLSCFMRQFVLNEAMINFTSVESTGKFYAATMGLWLHYREYLPIQYLELRYEDMVEDLESSARKILSFLDLDWNEQVLRYFENVSKRNVRTPSYSAIATPIYNRAVGRWRHYQTQIEPMMKSISPFVQEFGYIEKEGS